MNKQKSSKSGQGTNQYQSGTTSSTTSSTMKNQSTNAKQQASKAEYGTLTAKNDANNEYK